MPRNAKIILRNGTAAPSAADFVVGEPAWDKTNGRLYVKDAAGSMVEVTPYGLTDGNIASNAAIADSKLATISTAGKISNSATTATSNNTASAIVARDASGNFTAGTITANLTGTASNASAVPWSGVSSTPTTLGGYGITDAASSTHGHGNITNAGAIGTTSGLPIITTTSGVLTTGSFGSSAGTFCQGNDARLSDTRNTSNSITFNNAGSGGASGSTFNGSSALTVSYNTVGAPSTTGANASGTWGISISGSAASASSVPWSGVTSRPTTLSGYGITDAVSTSSTGTVTSTMIADGTIVNGDISASAAIAGSKINPAFGAQIISTSSKLRVIAASDQLEVGEVFTVSGCASFTRAGGTPQRVNRSSDGQLVAYYSNGTEQGGVSVSGATVSYNGAHLSRWSQLPGVDPYNPDARPEILRGTVMSNVDEMCDWTCPESGDTQYNEQLNKTKISDEEGDRSVAGVFQSWDDDDSTWVNDYYLAMTGDFVIRIAEGVTVNRGDLLISAGDGTAKPQADDVIRASTIAKVISTTASCTHPDGSYCVPCVLMAC